MDLKGVKISNLMDLFDYINNKYANKKVDVLINPSTLKILNGIVVIPWNVTLVFNDDIPEGSYLIRGEVD